MEDKIFQGAKAGSKFILANGHLAIYQWYDSNQNIHVLYDSHDGVLVKADSHGKSFKDKMSNVDRIIVDNKSTYNKVLAEKTIDSLLETTNNHANARQIADVAIMDLLNSLGYTDVVEVYRKTNFK